MKEALDFNIRCGNHINIVKELEDLEAKYKEDLNASFDSFNSWQEVDAETFNDEIVCKTVLQVMCKFGYLEAEECKNMCEKVTKIRLEFLEEKSTKDGNDNE